MASKVPSNLHDVYAVSMLEIHTYIRTSATGTKSEPELLSCTVLLLLQMPNKCYICLLHASVYDEAIGHSLEGGLENGSYYRRNYIFM